MFNQKGFTLIEMLIVLLIISVLLMIAIPNLTNNTDSVREKGCEALVLTAEAQIEAYYIDHDNYPESITALVTEGYLNSAECPNGDPLEEKVQLPNG
ncbi:competence type IV pilus major pilin ComGC [Halobacillus sp. Marseille-Q1614]|uniref:competence type IV pilus major pilin ComGC n=1 Tax=Halobacillus sp. Marseille-Q1614 TaxID=2709134 RepID=UPI00157098B2|nr:competence type IV pilus major pilin ComGC [Halobacillus sp. Marseille-Q1614]